MDVRVSSSGMTGRLAKDGRLTRGGMWLLRTLGLLVLLAVASEWRALAAVAWGARAAGIIAEVVDEVGDQRAYEVRVDFQGDGATRRVTRALSQGRGDVARLRAGDAVDVAYRRGAADGAVLLHPHENWAGASWIWILGVAFLAASWIWRPRPQ